jgi:hypothetical protein
MPNYTKRMVKLVVRFQNRVEAAEQKAAEAYDMDSAFDGGEFSGPAIHSDLMKEQERIAQALGFGSSELAYQVAQLVGATLRQPATFHGYPMPLPEAL